MLKNKITHPLAITMWDFSWLERRWDGAGYEDWHQALSELRERGYDAVRIDAYPHLIAADAERPWELQKIWDQHDWGSPTKITVQVQPHLNQFIAACAEHNIQVGLSTWFREDADNIRMHITSPEKLAEIWRSTLASIAEAGLLDHILYVDLCNEFPHPLWAPFMHQSKSLSGNIDAQADFDLTSPEGTTYMRTAIETLREAFPDLDYCFSFTTHEGFTSLSPDYSYMDLLEPHVWLTSYSDFYQQIDYRYERFDPVGYEKMVERAEPLYRSQPEFWQDRLRFGIQHTADWSRRAKLPLMTTECWGMVNYKDSPGLNWDWVKELCALGTREAASTGRWVAISTSNFCGPQFVGMWRDIAWHQELTEVIHNAPIDWD